MAGDDDDDAELDALSDDEEAAEEVAEHSQEGADGYAPAYHGRKGVPESVVGDKDLADGNEDPRRDEQKQFVQRGRSVGGERGGDDKHGREEAQARLAELAVVIGAGEESEPESQLAHKFIAAVRELRTNVGIPDRSELIRREDHQALAAAAIEECMAYPVPRLLDEAGTQDILNQITE